MLALFSAIAATFSLGFFYFVGALPGGVAAGLPLWLAAVVAWCGYASGAAVMLLLGVPARNWVARKLRIPLVRDPKKWIWRAWDRFGLVGLGLIAPVTIGPQAGCILAIAVGERPAATFLSLALGAIPWCLAFATMLALGFKLIP
jgi:hypothetical protein